MSRRSPPSTDNIQILAGDLLCTLAKNLLRQLAHADWEPAVRLQDAVELYSEVRLAVAIAEGADAVIQAIDEPVPPRGRS
jgi:geranylgeranyl pyrophosphate synthase